MAALLALGASIGWGLGDFIAGVKSRRLPVLAVVAAAQAAGFVAVAIVVLVVASAGPSTEVIGLAALSGVAQTAGIAAYYRALSTGAMGVVGPIAATAAVVPVVVGLATGERPTSPQSLGMLLAVAGVVTAAYQPTRARVDGRRLAVGVGLALLAAASLGTFFVLMGLASERGELTWIVFLNRAAAVALLAFLVALIVLRRRRGRRRASASSTPGAGNPTGTFSPTGNDALAVATVGLLSVGATFLFAGATTLGLLSVVSVLAALYPVTTVLLATVVLGERVHPFQRLGTAVALLGVVLIAGFGAD